MNSNIDPPQPSPAPTIGSEFPGLFPRTPDLSTTSSTQTQPQFPTSARDSADEQAQINRQEQYQSAGKALLGAAAGFLVGGPLGAALGGGLVGLSQVESDAIHRRNANGDQSTSTTSKPSNVGQSQRVDETHRPEFGNDAVDKSNAAFAQSPAQQLVGGDKEGAGITGAGALGGALLAGASGAKVGENEVQSPWTADDIKDRQGLVEDSHMAAPPAPDYGTPAIEKELSSLAASPAQQLLRSNTSSSVSQAEASLLAGAAGAKLAGKEVEEPAKAPLDKLEAKHADVGSPLGLAQDQDDEIQDDEAKAQPLKREARSAEHEAHISALPSRPDLSTATRPSESSFAAAVLSAGEDVHTPDETGATSYAGFGSGPREIRASDREEGEEPGLSEVRSVTPTPTSAVSVEEQQVAHNPAPLLPAALAGTAAGAALLGPETAKDAPQDFVPYSPPVTEQSPEAKLAAATPLPETPAAEETPAKSYAPAILGYGGLYPNSPQTENANPALSSTDIIPATVNAQNVKQAVQPVRTNAEVPRATSPEHSHGKELAAGAAGLGAGALAAHELGSRDQVLEPEPVQDEMPIEQALEAGPELATPVSTSSAAAPATLAAEEATPRVAPSPGPHAAHVPTTTNAMNHNQEVEPVQEGAVVPTEDKGKGKEVLEGAALAAGSGAIGSELLHREHEPSATVPPTLVSQPTSSTVDTVPTATQSNNGLDAQRAFPPLPHFNRDQALNGTDEPILNPSTHGTTNRAIDPKVLAAESTATSPEQAGFAAVPEGGTLTSAMQDFTHLSQPSQAAHEQALAESGAGGVGAVPVSEGAGVEKVEPEESHHKVPLAAVGAGAAGVGAGVLAGDVIAKDHVNTASNVPLDPASSAAVPPSSAAAVAPPPPVGAAPPVGQPTQTLAQPQPVQPVQPVQPAPTPVSRFVEQTAPTGAETPSSTRAVRGTPTASTTPTSSVFTGEATPPAPATATSRDASPARGRPLSGLQDGTSLFDAGIVNRSPHMHIQTTAKDGKHRLHRKSLSGSIRRMSADLGGQEGASPLGQGHGAGVQRPQLTTIESERRERMMDDVVGVRDPTFAAVPSASTVQPPPSAITTPSPHTTSASPHTPSSPASPASPGNANVGRKLSRRRQPSASESTPSTGEKKDGFFSRLMHGSGHKKQGSKGASPVASPRGSVDGGRP
ncbi:hypothetical protein JCM11641_008086 [Rhodosporidiobolus odoratus]